MSKLKGVSPVVAEVLLIGIATSAAVSAGIFLEGTIGDIQGNAEDRINQDERQEASSLSIEEGYNDSGYLLMDIRNTGSYAIRLKDGGQDSLNMYVEGKPSQWKYVDNNYRIEDDVTLEVQKDVSLNTTEPFPNPSDTLEVQITGPYETEAYLQCYSDGGECI